jgi:glycosyltransferase involved in cell wall biosynthesis
MIVRLLVKDVKVIPLAIYFLKLVRGGIPAFFKRENMHHSWCKPDAALSIFLRTNDVDIALVNHMFHSDFAYKYIPAKKYICETHDIQINQLLLRRPELLENYDNELSYELDVLKQYDAVVNLNRIEHKIIEQSVADKAYYIQPPIVKRDVVIRYESLTELLAEQSEYVDCEKVPLLFDLLIVADGHPANIESVNSFIDNVFNKLPKGTTLGVVGKMAGFLNADVVGATTTENGIYPIGFVQDLANIYDFTKIVVLPDTIGEGVPIKSNEAIAKKVPFVATLHALRGFSQDELTLADISAVTSNDEMRQRIIEMLASDISRQRVCEKLELLIEQHSLENYFTKWDDVISCN